MTRAELHNITGFHPDSIAAAAAFLRNEMKPRKGGGDATALINREGWMNGYLDAIEALESAIIKKPDPTEKAPARPYSQPQFAPNENQNKA